jgi:polygalacturonase
VKSFPAFTVVAALFAAALPAFSQSQSPEPHPCIIGGVQQIVSPSGNEAADTANIQGAMDACTVAASPTGIPVYVQLEPGSYTIKPIVMRSYVFLLIPKGVVVNASTVIADYQIPGSNTCGSVSSSSTGCVPLISAGQNGQPPASYSGIIGSRAVGIMGGTIDGHGWDVTSNGSTWWEIAQAAKNAGKNQVNPRLIEFDKGQNITIRDITLENSPYFHVVFSQCSYVTALDVTVDTPSPGRSGSDYNTDGIDPISSSFVSITNCHISDGDDNIAITAANKGPSHDITIQNCRFGAGHGVSIGSGTNSGVSNIHVKQVFFDGTDNGLRIKSSSSEGGPVYQIYYDTVCMKSINTGSKSSKNGAIVLDTQYSSGNGTLPPYYHDIHFHDVYSDTASATISGQAWDNVRLNGAGGTQPISNVSFFNVEFTQPKTATSVANIDPTTIYLYSNSPNLTIPGVSVTPAPVIDPHFNSPANPNLAGFCQTENQ